MEYGNDASDHVCQSNKSISMQVRRWRMSGRGRLIITERTYWLFIEGLTMYLSLRDVQKIFRIIDKNFKTATVFVETMNPFIVKSIKEKSIDKSGTKFTRGVKNGMMLAKFVEPFRLIKDYSLKVSHKLYI